jgi:hypothetical protein
MSSCGASGKCFFVARRTSSSVERERERVDRDRDNRNSDDRNRNDRNGGNRDRGNRNRE